MSLVTEVDSKTVTASSRTTAMIDESVRREAEAFDLAQRKANLYASSTLVPAHYMNNVGNVMIAQNMAKRLGADLLMVMQNLYVVHGNPSWSAQFMVACFNQCGRFSSIKYRFEGKKGTDDYGCIAYATEISTGELCEGAKVDWNMVKAEGWSAKKGSKWKTMPEQMFRYRAATFLIRVTAPEIAMGLQSKEEIEDAKGVIDSVAVVSGKPKLLEDIVSEVETDSADTTEPVTETYIRRASECNTEDDLSQLINEAENEFSDMSKADRKSLLDSIIEAYKSKEASAS